MTSICNDPQGSTRAASHYPSTVSGPPLHSYTAESADGVTTTVEAPCAHEEKHTFLVSVLHCYQLSSQTKVAAQSAIAPLYPSMCCSEVQVGWLT